MDQFSHWRWQPRRPHLHEPGCRRIGRADDDGSQPRIARARELVSTGVFGAAGTDRDCGPRNGWLGSYQRRSYRVSRRTGWQIDRGPRRNARLRHHEPGVSRRRRGDDPFGAGGRGSTRRSFSNAGRRFRGCTRDPTPRWGERCLRTCAGRIAGLDFCGDLVFPEHVPGGSACGQRVCRALCGRGRGCASPGGQPPDPGPSDAVVARQLLRIQSSLVAPRSPAFHRLNSRYRHLPMVGEWPVLGLGRLRLLPRHLRPCLELRTRHGAVVPRPRAVCP